MNKAIDSIEFENSKFLLKLVLEDFLEYVESKHGLFSDIFI